MNSTAILTDSNTTAHYAVLMAMLAPAFFLTATASLLLTANNRLARIIDRARMLLGELAALDDAATVERALIEQRIAMQRRRSLTILRSGQLLYVAITCFVGTSLTIAADAFMAFRFGHIPTLLASLGVLALLLASVLLARESTLAVSAINEEMDHRHIAPKKPAT